MLRLNHGRLQTHLCGEQNCLTKHSNLPLTYKFHCRRVTIDIDNPPQWTRRVDTAEENASFFALYPVHNIPAARHVEEEDRARLGVALGQRLGPEAGLVGQVGTGITRQLSTVDGRRVVGCEPKPNHPTPTRRGFSKSEQENYG